MNIRTAEALGKRLADIRMPKPKHPCPHFIEMMRKLGDGKSALVFRWSPKKEEMAGFFIKPLPQRFWKKFGER